MYGTASRRAGGDMLPRPARLRNGFQQHLQPHSRGTHRMSYGSPHRFRSNIFSRSALGEKLGLRAYSQYSGYGYSAHASAMRAVWGIIGINTVVFGAWHYARVQTDNVLLVKFQENAACSLDNIRAGRYYMLVTSAFMHQDPTHFLFNMLAFHAFGTMLSFVPGIGGGIITSLALGSAIAGSTAWLYQQNADRCARTSRSPQSHMVRSKSAIGASGMVMGLSGAATCLMPFAPVHIFFIPVAVPLWLFTGLYMAIDLYFLRSAESKIGHSAHLGGTAFGALFYVLYLRRFGGIFSMMGRRFRR